MVDLARCSQKCLVGYIKQMTGESTTVRVYAMSRQARIWSIILLLLGAFSSVEFLTGRIVLDFRHAELMITGIIALAVGAFGTAYTFTARVTLSDYGIELRNLLEKKRLRSSEIRGRIEIVRASSKGTTSTWKVVPKDHKARTLTLSPSFAFDSAFYEWLNKIPPLDSEDLK